MSAAAISNLRDLYLSESGAIRERFKHSGDGGAAVRGRASLVDSIALQLYAAFVGPDLEGPEGFCLAALGGFGREVLFPGSDVDILFLLEDGRAEQRYRQAIANICREMWDLRLRVSPTTRNLAECGRLYRDNLEFNVSLLDCRYLGGDARLFTRLHDEVLPQLVVRERQPLVQNLAELTGTRHAKYGQTIFHLEPNVKEGPGGLRDYNVAGWLALISAIEKRRAWPPAEQLLAQELRDDCLRAFDFLCAVRCFLHYRQGRDDNALSYEFQAEAAAEGIGAKAAVAVDAAEWMRLYFRHTRVIDRVTTQLLDDAAGARSSLYRAFEDWRSRLSNADFQVSHGRILLRQSTAMEDASTVLSLFEFVARHGLKISRDAEHRIEKALPRLRQSLPRLPGLWDRLRAILTLRYSADALRALHRTGLLVVLVPEFQAIDALVIRDYYHRYTVDEHSFIAIENLHRLRQAEDPWDKRFREILEETERPELLFFALLVHDIGKGMSVANHVTGSLQALDRILARLGLAAEAEDAVRFLVSSHLEMSMTLSRRDIFDPETVRVLAERVGTPERLKMLCLLTYADIKSVNPEALTPWKAEMLWQLYAATINHMNRSLDDERLRPEQLEAERMRRLQETAPEGLSAFLEGFPRRYVLTHSPAEISEHLRMAKALSGDPVQISLQKRSQFYELTLITPDRPMLFATMAGTLAAWGMNIVKADAFCNRAGTVLDVFYFADLFRTFDLNPSEIERFKNNLLAILGGEVSLAALMAGRAKSGGTRPAKVSVPPRLRFDNESSSHSTLLELVAQDRPGLLYNVSSKLAKHGCNIEVAIIDTEGQKAIDVFYLTVNGAKLDAARQEALAEALLEDI
ncbi:MAG TPA: [protein-PII] uridylyltransferase [Terriglobales bacterium]|jgi:[protein-PII] uridylyltransferase|nr:[protein-PII] uridylyltransferase [Terriglobales bacterium]